LRLTYLLAIAMGTYERQGLGNQRRNLENRQSLTGSKQSDTDAHDHLNNNRWGWQADWTYLMMMAFSFCLVLAKGERASDNFRSM